MTQFLFGVGFAVIMVGYLVVYFYIAYLETKEGEKE
jgi:hypothetical protein